MVVVPYEFEAYHEVSEAVYRILLRHAALVQPMSCDEAYLDVSACADPAALAATLRREIRAATSCNASVGIGPSILLAAMATKKAKPDGVFRVRPEVRAAGVCMFFTAPLCWCFAAEAGAWCWRTR